jgi:Mlc titration factor MtfA (ptsG expression regulator)
MLLILAKIEKTGNPVIYFFATILIGALVIAFIRLLKTGFSLFRDEQVKSGFVNYSNEKETAVRLHLGAFSYFRKLSSKGKTAFVQRTLNFLETHEVYGEDDFSPGLPAKIHVAAAATQLTFGLRDFAFTHFDTVILYPGIFRIHPEGPLMKGAATPNGEIRISLKDFDAGYDNPSDKLNVGLHEFGHGLFMEFLKSANDDENADEGMKRNLYNYIEESDRMLNEGKHKDLFLRDYAFTNRHEFFAVSVEHFFEAPKEFKEKLPKLYSTLMNLLQQDPAGEQQDYGIWRNPLE